MIVVLADGTFDPVHMGHVRYLHAAKALGDSLIVRVAPDSAITAKGRVPFQTHRERMHLISALLPHGYVCGMPSLAEAIAKFKPRYLVKGKDWANRLPEDVVAACGRFGTQIVYTDTQERTSSERLAG